MTLSSSNIQSIQKNFSTQPVLEAYFFESYSRNEAKQNKDVLVDLDYSKSVGLEFLQKVDLVSSRGLSKFIKSIIEKERELIFER